MDKSIEVRLFGGPVYKKDNLMKMDPEQLRALLRERVHHNIEVPFYPLIREWKGDPKPKFGQQAQLVFDVWEERGFTQDDPDIQWAREYVEFAEKVRKGENIEYNRPISKPFNEKEMEVVNKLIYGRNSIREWEDKPISDEMIEKILEAGRAAPIGCNLGELRFIILKEPKEIEMIRSDISTKNSVIIVICYDKRMPRVVAQDKIVPQNAGFDAAAAADHMLLMAHALGLGAVWLSKTVKSENTKDTGEIFKIKYGLPTYIEVALHIAVGWPAIGHIKSQRMPLSNMMVSRENR